MGRVKEWIEALVGNQENEEDIAFEGLVDKETPKNRGIFSESVDNIGRIEKEIFSDRANKTGINKGTNTRSGHQEQPISRSKNTGRTKSNDDYTR